MKTKTYTAQLLVTVKVKTDDKVAVNNCVEHLSNMIRCIGFGGAGSFGKYNDKVAWYDSSVKSVRRFSSSKEK